MRDNVILQCGACKRRNYVTSKNKKEERWYFVPMHQVLRKITITRVRKITRVRVDIVVEEETR